MKNTILFSFMLVLLASCSTESEKLTYTTLLLDITREEMMLEEPDTALLSQWVIPQQATSGSIFEIGYITDFYQNRVERTQLTPSNFLVNTLQRKAEQQAFLHKTIAVTHKAINTTGGREHSIVFRQIALAINRQILCENCVQGHLFVLSDLMEHSTHLSFYNDKTLSFFQAQPDSLYTLLDKLFPIPTIKDKRLILALVYQPTNREDDTRYHHISELLIPYYQSKGLEVFRYTSLTEAIKNTHKP